MNGKETQRIILLDLLRAIAVIMMLLGHTIHTLLETSYSDSTSVIFQSWIFIRGLTAPVFIFSSGLIFTYLLLQKPLSYQNNPRIRKGIVRGITLILIGYLLRYPKINIFKLAESSNEQWLTFFTVDVLHLIGVGLLLILALAYFAYYVRIDLSLFYFLFVLVVLFTAPFINSLGWGNTFIPIASYFTFEFGSIFPLFPYLLYVFLGAVFGVYFSKDNSLIKIFLFMLFILGLGLSIILLVLILSNYFGIDLFFGSLIKIGIVLVLFSTLGLLTRNVDSIPNYLRSLARNSLWIYVIHLVILYGSPASIGLFQIVGKTQTAEVALLTAVTMIILMTIISLGIDKLRVRKIKVF